MERIKRNRRLTPEEAAKYNLIRKQAEQDFPPSPPKWTVFIEFRKRDGNPDQWWRRAGSYGTEADREIFQQWVDEMNKTDTLFICRVSPPVRPSHCAAL